MTAIKLPGQLELPTVIDHAKEKAKQEAWALVSKTYEQKSPVPRDVQLAKLLRDYENRPTSETWSRIQALAAEILK